VKSPAEGSSPAVLGVISQMSTRALRTTRLLTIAALACLGLAVFAQSALASHSRIQVAKVNQGGNPSDQFAFHPTFTWGPGTQMAIPAPSYSDFSLAGGQTSQNFDVACNTNTQLWACDKDYSNVTLQVAELAKPGYTLTDVTCRRTQSTDVNNAFSAGAPTTSSPIKPASEVSVNLAAGTVNLNMSYNEWAICWFTNTYTGTPPGSGTTGSSGQTTPSPQIQVSPETVRPGSAKLHGPKGCPDTNAVAATVTGKRIVKVTFYVDHKKVKVLTKPNKRGGWSLAVNMRKIAYGSHRVEAKVEFAKSSGTKTKTLRLSFSRCGANNVRPQFTG
jgi:hypothetical protein